MYYGVFAHFLLNAGYYDHDSHKPNNISSVALKSNTPPTSPYLRWSGIPRSV